MASSFEAWRKAALKYADQHPEIDLWPFQIARMASDIAWCMEGLKIKPESIQEAYEDWVSGQNPYSPHCIHLDDENFTAHMKRVDETTRNTIYQDVLETGMHSIIARKFADTVSYFHYEKKNLPKAIKDWFDGVDTQSPHHVPFDAINVEERKARKAFIRSQCPEMSNLIFELRFGFKHSCDTLKSH